MDFDTLFNRLTKTWDTCINYAADKNIYVTWEFEPGFAFNKPSYVLKVLDKLQHENFGLMYDTCHGQMVGVNGTRQEGEKEVVTNQLELIKKFSGRINDETSAHPPFGEGVLDFDEIVPELVKENVGHDWWTVDLCFWPEAWPATEKCKNALDQLVSKYG